jgi:hypothetical protein
MSKHFDQSQLRLLDDVEEIEIETRTGLLETDTPQRTVVWVVVVDEDVYVRSVNGELAHWYQPIPWVRSTRTTGACQFMRPRPSTRSSNSG